MWHCLHSSIYCNKFNSVALLKNHIYMTITGQSPALNNHDRTFIEIDKRTNIMYRPNFDSFQSAFMQYWGLRIFLCAPWTAEMRSFVFKWIHDLCRRVIRRGTEGKGKEWEYTRDIKRSHWRLLHNFIFWRLTFYEECKIKRRNQKTRERRKPHISCFCDLDRFPGESGKVEMNSI